MLRDEPVRVRANCRDLAKLRGVVEIFFNGVGYEIKFWAEKGSSSSRNKDGVSGSGMTRDRKGPDKSNGGNQDHKQNDTTDDTDKTVGIWGSKNKNFLPHKLGLL